MSGGTGSDTAAFANAMERIALLAMRAIDEKVTAGWSAEYRIAFWQAFISGAIDRLHEAQRDAAGLS